MGAKISKKKIDQHSHRVGEVHQGIPAERSRCVAATSERLVGLVGGHFGDSYIHTADQNPFLFTNVPSTHLWRKTVLKERRGRVFYNLDVQKVLGLWVGAVSTAGDFETVFREIPLLFKEGFPTSLS